MAIKILVVDDSATMRKILEMTFAGEDAQVVTADNAPAALAKAGDFRPNVILADTSMKPDGYELAQALRGQPTLAGTPLIVLASQQNPYDAARGSTSGVDDHIVKPFDTQALIDKVKAVVARGRAGAPAPSPAAAAPQAPVAAPAVPMPAAPRPPAPPTPAAASAAAPPRDLKRTMAFGTPLAPIANPVGPVQRTTESTVGPLPVAPPPAPKPAAPPALELDDEPIELRPAVVKPAAPAPVAAPTPPRPPAPAVPAPTAPKPPAPAAAPVAAPAPTPSPAPVAPVAAASAPVAKVAAATSSNGALAGKLAGLGLDAQQVAGVLALSREVIEQVVWEVVPDLAETIIREEIKRLTAE